MQALNACPVCAGRRIQPYSLTPPSERRNGLHVSQSQCRSCHLVFSNPVADGGELARYYALQYYNEAEGSAGVEGPALERLVRERVQAGMQGLRQMILPYVTRGRFFEVGAGFGAIMEAARRLGFTVAGVEPSEDAVRFAHQHLGLTELKLGMFSADQWPEAFCDVVYTHHVIEHVLDLRAFVEGIHRVLKPGGIAVIATENCHNSWVMYRTVRSWAQGRRLPEFQTSDHHTYYFCNHSLKHLLRSAKFRILRSTVYSHSLEEKLRNARFRSFWTKAFFYLLHYGDVCSGRGNRLVVWCRRP